MHSKQTNLYLYSFAVIISLIFFSSCSAEHKAKKVAESFLKAYYVDFDFDKARQLSSNDSHSGINYKENMSTLSPFAKEESPKLEIISIEINPDDKTQAICHYKLGDQEKTLPLQKNGSKWLVDTDDEAIEGESGGSFSGVQNVGFTSAASSETLPTDGPGARARKKAESRGKNNNQE